MSQHNAEHRLFINGAPVDAEGGATYDVINPATEEVVVWWRRPPRRTALLTLATAAMGLLPVTTSRA